MNNGGAIAADSPPAGWFARPIGVLVEPFTKVLAGRLGRVRGLGASEQDVLVTAGTKAIHEGAHAKLSRTLLLELHAAALTGAIEEGDERRQWEQFIDLACTPDFDAHLRARYPRLHERLATVCRFQIESVLALAERLAADRAALAGLPGGPRGDLVAAGFGAGDVHRGGQTVTRLDFDDGSAMYKPRAMQVDVAIDALLACVVDHVPVDRRIRVPRVLVRDGYGWTEVVEHRYCDGDAELACFHRNLGHWLAVMRLVGGTDLHSENLIAHGPIPIVIDVETVLTTDAPMPPSGRGDAVDLAAAAIRDTVLRTGLLPVRVGGHAMAGVDISAAGSLQGQQPTIPMPTIVGGGTSAARFGETPVSFPKAKNHPSPTPVLLHYWDQVLAGFRELTAHIPTIAARAGGAAALLRDFAGCEVREIRRPTQAYVDIMRMLWHPASLHDERAARARAEDILLRNARAVPTGSTEPAEIAREVDDLLVGDVPVFTHVVDDARIDAVVRAWRSIDLELEEMTIQGALVSAYLNEKTAPPRVRIPPERLRDDALDARRRALGAATVRQLADHAIRGRDGTVTWISPVLTEFGWIIRPLPADVYSGQGGVAVALAEYAHEVQRRRADAVDGLDGLLSGTIAVLRAAEDEVPTARLGGLIGVASQVWTWCTLHDLLGERWMLDRAIARAALLEPRIANDTRVLEVLDGVAGAIVPMLNLAEITGDDRWLGVAAGAGRRLEAAAQHEANGARWSTDLFPEGVGGFAHGAAGIGWSLARLGLSDAGASEDRRRWLDLAARAWAFEESRYRPEAGNWRDVRRGVDIEYFTSWCHGSTGVGLAAGDLYARTGDVAYRDVAMRAWGAGAREGFGWSHTLCHGDLGLWEMLEVGRRVDPGYDGPRPDRTSAEVLSSLEERGAVGGMARDAFSPGLMPGLAGVVHLLLRMHPESRLASPLLLSRRTERAA